MLTRWLVALGLLATAVTASAASPVASRPGPPAADTKAKAEAVRAVVKERAEGARKRIRARLEKRAQRHARAQARTTATIAATTASPAGKPTRPAPALQQTKTARTPLRVATTAPNAPANAENATAAKPVPAVAMITTAPAAIRPPAPDNSTGASPRKGIPKGFEEWFAPQKTAIDLYYGGRYLMTTLVEYTLDSVTFLNPPEVSTHMPGLRSTAEFSVMLAESQPSNADKVCVRPNQPLCGRLEPATVGVIFDETRFRADLFVHPSLLVEVQRGGKQYLPPPVHTSTTLVQNIGVLYAGSSEGENRFSLLGRTRAGKGPQYAFANWASTDANAFGIDEIGYTQDRQDIQISAGLFEPTIDALRAVPRQPIVGASMATSLLTRTDLESTLATPIELFLPIRGRVDIFRDGRLISTDFYEAGNQSIDTSRLPPGAYDIEVAVTDVAGATRRQQQLFIKSALMAPPGEPQWFADAGQVMKRNVDGGIPEDFGTPQLRGGYRWRHRPWLGLGAAGAITGNGALIELSSGLLLGWVEGSAELYASSAGGSGFGLRGLTRRDRLVMSASLQHTQADDPEPDTYRLLPSNQRLASLNASHPFRNGLLSASLSQREDARGDSTERFTLGYSRIFRLGQGHSLHLQTEAGNESGNALALVTLQWRNTVGNWSNFGQVQVRQQDADDNADRIAVAAGTTWRDGDRFVDDVQVDLRAEVGDQNHSLSVEGQHLSQFGRGKLGLSTAQISGLDQTLSSLGYDTSIVVDADGSVTPGGGPHLNTAAIVIDPGSTRDAFLEISADGQPQFIARGGRKAALTLPPYHQYRIRMKDTGMALTQFDDQSREVTLYPGHVVNLDWKVETINVLIGRITMPDGEPARHARLEGVEGMAMTDEDGFVQTEIRGDVRELKVRLTSGECVTPLPAAAADNVIRAMKLVCTPTSAETGNMPEATAPQP